MVVIEYISDKWTSSIRAFNRRPRILPIKGKSLEIFVRATESYLSRRSKNIQNYVSRHASWKKMPGSKAQLDFATKLGLESIFKSYSKSSAIDWLSWSRSLNKGDLARFITLLKFGAGKRMKERLKLEDIAMKKNQRHEEKKQCDLFIYNSKTEK